jgi:hypothetical protein
VAAPIPEIPPSVNQSVSTKETAKSLPKQGNFKARVPVLELTADEKAEFERKFTEKIEPAIEAWCKTYAGHTPVQAQDITADKLREISPGSSFQGYAFVINGTTLDVCDDHGSVYVDYLLAPTARELYQLPNNPAPPVEPAVGKEEILRLLKEDSGTDFPPDQIAIRPTSYACAMNGGVFVDVGEGVHRPYYPLTKFSMVFGPDGNLAFYGRSLRPN